MANILWLGSNDGSRQRRSGVGISSESHTLQHRPGLRFVSAGILLWLAVVVIIAVAATSC